jgi:16S rRNA (guanine527-N7)-methyltransferase
MSRESRFEVLLANALPHLSPESQARLTDYYHLVVKWNQRISLTTLTSPEEFVERHLGEGCFVATLVAPGIERFWDIGSGLGIPGVPVAVIRPDLEVKLIESNRKKAIFLEEAVDVLGLKNVVVMNVRFETLTDWGPVDCLSLRAVDRMERVVAEVAARATTAGQLLIFGGAGLKVQEREGYKVRKHALPGSDNSFVYQA